jgi:hypothetical protein
MAAAHPDDLELQFLTQEQLEQLELTEEENNSQECLVYHEEEKQHPSPLKQCPQPAAATPCIPQMIEYQALSSAQSTQRQ